MPLLMEETTWNMSNLQSPENM